jgi:uncharacterized protein YndB with AHSA1/START domain
MHLPHRLERTVLIEAPRDLVFQFFSDSARWASWWGAGSTTDGSVGGRVTIRFPNNIEAAGEIVELAAPQRIAFTYGYASGTPVPVGGSLVTVTLEEVPRGTRLRLTHDFAEAGMRDHHEQGWRFQLSVFANAVANELHRDAVDLIDAWFAVWAEPDERSRAVTLSTIAAADVQLRDRHSWIDGLAELGQHIAASQRFMPGVRLQRHGGVRHCLGMVLVDWIAASATGEPRGRGTNVFVLGSEGRIESVTGFWG